MKITAEELKDIKLESIIQDTDIKKWINDELPNIINNCKQAAKDSKNNYSHYIPYFITRDILKLCFINCILSESHTTDQTGRFVDIIWDIKDFFDHMTQINNHTCCSKKNNMNTGMYDLYTVFGS